MKTAASATHHREATSADLGGICALGLQVNLLHHEVRLLTLAKPLAP